MGEVLVNKVTESGLISLDLAAYCPSGEISVFDLKEYLFMGLILKEKDYRAALAVTDWEVYRNKYVGITCSVDAIIPMWAHMLAAVCLEPVAKEVIFGDEKKVKETVLVKKLRELKGEDFMDKRVVVKGCGEEVIPEAAYVAISLKLRPYVKSIMYGEPCSTVPVYKRK
jgi:hypothetical protein